MVSLLFDYVLCCFWKTIENKADLHITCIRCKNTRNQINFHLLRFEMLTENHGEIQAMQWRPLAA